MQSHEQDTDHFLTAHVPSVGEGGRIVGGKISSILRLFPRTKHQWLGADGIQSAHLSMARSSTQGLISVSNEAKCGVLRCAPKAPSSV
jgi:hypothetical protein